MAGRSPTFQYLINNISQDANNCWNWLGAISGNGYGYLRYEGATYLTHRFFYTAYKGQIPLNFEIDHLCRNTRCCNPSHLEAVNSGTNSARGLRGYAIRQYCRSGKHDITLPNAVANNGNGRRTCRGCKNERSKMAYNKRMGHT